MNKILFQNFFKLREEPPPVDDSCARGYIYDYLEGFGICFEPGVFESEPRLRSVMTKDLAYIVSFLPAKQYEIMSDMKYDINKDYQVIKLNIIRH